MCLTHYIKGFVVILFIFCIMFPANAQEVDEGEGVFKAICGLCHQLPEPDILRPNQWRVVLDNMKVRMRQKGLEPLTDEQSEKVFQYIERMSRQ